MGAILEVEHIRKSFGNAEILKDISFTMNKGSTLSIIGSSGSGKTTLLRCLNFLEAPDEGVIRVQGETIFNSKDHAARSEAEIRKKRLSSVSMGRPFSIQKTMPPEVKRKSGKDGCILALFSSRSTFFRNIQLCRM